MTSAEPVSPDAFRRFDLEGRRVLVTGAGHGLGLATASAFVGAGAKVVGMDFDGDGLDALGDRYELAARIVTNVDETESVDQGVEQAIAALGGLDVIVNLAGRYPHAPLGTTDPQFMVDLLNTNVVGTARVVRAAHGALVESGVGRVINVSSITYFTALPDGMGAYITSKAAVIGYTRALARELGPHGVCVNAIAPGAIPTRAERVLDDTKAYDRQVIEAQCIKHRGSVDDVACTAMFLASDAAGFITGQTLLVDGGWSFN